MTKGTEVQGDQDTNFTKDFQKGSLLVVKTKEGKLSGKVAQVIGAHKMILADSMRVSGDAQVKSEHHELFSRTMSMPATLLIFILSAIPCVLFLPSYFPASWWPITTLCSLHLACLITRVIYHVVRDKPISRKEEMSEFSIGPKTYSDTPAEKKMANVESMSPYRLQPFVDQGDMFEQVEHALAHGGTIGIFPEGGTHDGTQLLPLKWGLSTMVLGTLAKHEGPDPPKISVVPVGLNYFHPHQFRSTVSVDFGDPIEISPELAIPWRSGNKEEMQKASQAVMKLVMDGAHATTLQVGHARISSTLFSACAAVSR